MNEIQLVRSNSPSFEHVYVANQRCECGGYFATVKQELLNTPAGPVDRITGRCKVCEAERAFCFDISSFFGNFDRYAHFFEVDRRFKEAIAHIREGQMVDAEMLLRQIIDPDEGEPEFAWAYYQLGMVLIAQRRPEEAVVHFERAAEIQPLEERIQEALERTRQLLESMQG
jgi:tetratricopeptide (TPR) repeat protein